MLMLVLLLALALLLLLPLSLQLLQLLTLAQTINNYVDEAKNYGTGLDASLGALTAGGERAYAPRGVKVDGAGNVRSHYIK